MCNAYYCNFKLQHAILNSNALPKLNFILFFLYFTDNSQFPQFLQPPLPSLDSEYNNNVDDACDGSSNMN